MTWSRFSFWVFAITCGLNAFAQPPSDPSGSLDRLEHLEATVQLLQLELERLHEDRSVTQVLGHDRVEIPHPCDAPACDGADPTHSRTHYVTYDDGWVLRPFDRVTTPFELKFNLHNQFRYTGFNRSVRTFTNSAGTTTPIRSRNDFDVNRGRLVFSGYAFDPRFTFYTNIDYNTVAQNPVLLLLSWISFRHSDALTISAGLGKVPGTWEWIETSRRTLGSERTMATTFFRPSITAGIWANGELFENIYYEALVGDGFNTFTLRASELDTNLAYSASVWAEPLGDFGVGFSDLEEHACLAMRIGHGFTFASNDSEPTGEPGPEQTVIRLSDGTRLVEPGALAPGVTVNQFDISLYAVHLGLKYRGASFATEYFFRWLTSLEGNGPLPVNSLFDHGFYVQGGLFVIPKRLELYSIGSHVTGDYGSGHEIAAGFNYYVGGRRGSRITFDVSHINDSPADQSRTGFVAGASGTLFRAQMWTFF